MSGKHVDLTGHVDALPRGYVKFRVRPAHKAQPPQMRRVPLTARSGAVLLTAAYEADEGTWTPGEVPPDVTPQWHDVWTGDPDTDKAWAHNVD